MGSQRTASTQSGLVRALLGGAAGGLALNVVNTGMTFLTTAVLARVLGVSDYGVFAFVVALGLVLAVPAVLGFDRLSTRDVAAYVARSSWDSLRGLVLSANLAVVLTSSIVALGAAVWAILSVNDQVLLRGLMIGLLAIPLMAVGRVGQGVLIGLHRVVSAQVPDLAIRPTLLLAIVLGVLMLGPGEIDSSMAVFLHVLTVAAATGVTLALLRRSWPSEASGIAARYETRSWFKSSLSLTLLSGITVLNAQSGTVLAGVLRGPEDAGLFSVAARGAALIAFGLGAVNAALQPTVARLWALGRQDELQHVVTVAARATLLFAVPVSGIFILFSTQILSVAFGGDYAAAAPALVILSVAQLLNAGMGSVGTLLVMTGHQREAASGIAVGAGLNIGLALVLIPLAGVMGAAIAAAISVVTWNVLLATAAVRHLDIHATALGRLSVRRSSPRG